MYVEDKYTLKPKKNKDNMYLEGYGKHWGEKLTFTIGVSYCFCGIFGLIRGFNNFKPSGLVDMKDIRGMKFDRSLKTAGEYGNGGASASLMYCLISKTLDLLFEEEISEFGPWARNTISAGITGGLYKSTLGLRPMLFGSFLGVVLINGLMFGTRWMNDKGFIRFSIEI